MNLSLTLQPDHSVDFSTRMMSATVNTEAAASGLVREFLELARIEARSFAAPGIAYSSKSQTLNIGLFLLVTADSLGPAVEQPVLLSDLCCGW